MNKKILRKIYNSIQLNMGIKKYASTLYKKLKFIYDQKIIYPLSTKINNYVYQRIIDHYGADYKWNNQKSQNLNKKTHNYGYGLFHYAMVRNQRPKKVLCVGSMYGYIPYMLAKACQDNGYGSVDFVDANRDMKSNKNKKNHFYGQGFWQRKNLEKHFDYFLDKKYIKIHVTKTKNFANKYPKKKYDLIYLDGDHSYKGAKLDLKLFWPKLNKDGFMCFHDIHLVFPDIMGVEYSYKKFWEELMKKQTYQYKFELSNHYSGLGFLQKL